MSIQSAVINDLTSESLPLLHGLYHHCVPIYRCVLNWRYHVYRCRVTRERTLPLDRLVDYVLLRNLIYLDTIALVSVRDPESLATDRRRLCATVKKAVPPNLLSSSILGKFTNLESCLPVFVSQDFGGVDLPNLARWCGHTLRELGVEVTGIADVSFVEVMCIAETNAVVVQFPVLENMRLALGTSDLDFVWRFIIPRLRRLALNTMLNNLFGLAAFPTLQVLDVRRSAKSISGVALQGPLRLPYSLPHLISLDLPLSSRAIDNVPNSYRTTLTALALNLSTLSVNECETHSCRLSLVYNIFP
jgi:hypothetical protein